MVTTTFAAPLNNQIPHLIEKGVLGDLTYVTFNSAVGTPVDPFPKYGTEFGPSQKLELETAVI
jgi:hypothetical protein